MRERQLASLEQLGLSMAEAQVYLALVRSSTPMGASAVVSATGVPRSSVYPTLSALADAGLVQAEAGYGGRFSAVPAEQALPSLIVREKEKLSHREKVAEELARDLKPMGDSVAGRAEAELIQVLRDPRVIAERFERLEAEVERQMDGFIKAPIFCRSDNPPLNKALSRGVRVRGLYERAVLEDPAVKPTLAAFIAQGEEARLYDGELPHKLAIFDRQNILLPLITPSGQGRTLFIRHPQLAASLEMLFESLWERAEPLTLGSSATGSRKAAKAPARGVQGRRASSTTNNITKL